MNSRSKMKQMENNNYAEIIYHHGSLAADQKFLMNNEISLFNGNASYINR